MRFEFASPPRVVFGPGVSREAGALAKEFGRRALVITGRNHDRAKNLLSALQSSGVSATIFPVAGEPEIQTVEQGVALGKSERCDLVIGFGGGSALDAAKAIAVMLTNDGTLLDYLEVIGRGKPLPRAGAAFIAIPTTAGTGSEVTRNAVLASPEHKVKVSLRSPLMLAKVALIDPELTYDLPPDITASTGMDALTQVIEPFTCARTNPLTDGLCREGITRAARSLSIAFHDGRNTAARTDMATASLFGGFALANAGLGAVHGFAGPIGGMFPAPHGAVCAALLPHVMATNIRALRERAAGSETLRRYDEVGRLLTSQSDATADDGVKWVAQLVRELKIPGLRTFGLDESTVNEVVAKAANASSMKANPIPLTPDELAQTLRAAL
jgi:alcohol dehydrogenase class IV